MNQTKNPKRANRGIVWVWLVVIIACSVLTIVWLPLSMVAYQFIDQITSMYAFSPEQQLTIDMLGIGGLWLPVIMFWGFVAWGLKQSINPQEVSYQYG